MLTLSPKLLEAFSRDVVRPVWLVQIQIDDATRWSFTSAVITEVGVHAGAENVLAPEGTHPRIVECVSVAAEKDPFTFEFSMGSCEVRLLDDNATPGPARLMIYTHRLAGKAMYVWLGAEGVNQEDWARVFVGVVRDHVCEPGLIAIHADDATGLLLQAMVEPSDWFATHPLDIALLLASQASLPFAMYDGSTFSPDQYDAGTTPMSHWNVTAPVKNAARSNERNTDREGSVRDQYIGTIYGFPNARTAPPKWGDPMQAKSALSELGQVLGGSFLPDEDGPVRFKLYDRTRDVSRDLTETDIVSVEPVGVTHNITNRVTVTYGIEGENSLQVYDSTSVTTHAFPGETERYFDSDIKCAWANGDAELQTGIGTGDAEIVVAKAGQEAFTGTRYDLSGWSGNGALPPQDAWRELDGSGPSPFVTGTRVAYFLITALGSGSAVEIVKATYAIADDTNIFIHNPPNGRRVIDRWTFGVVRAQFGTTAVIHDSGARVHDITIPVAMAQVRLQRFAYGCPEAEIRIGLRHLDLQVGDFISFPDALQSWYSRTEITGDTVWEITRKELDLGEEPGLRLKVLAAVDTYAIPSNSLAYVVPTARQSVFKATAKLAYDKTYGNAHVISGFTSSSSASLEETLAAGIAATPGSHWESNTPIPVAVKPSRDSYLYVDPDARGIIVIDVANSDPAPTTPGGCALLHKVVTNATTITTVTDSRDLYALDGGKLEPDSIELEALPGASIKGAGVMLVWSKVFAAGVAGSADDVTVDLTVDVDIRIIDVIVAITTAIGGSTATLRDASGGGGNALSSALDTASTGRKASTLAEFPAVAAGGSIYLRRSDRGIAGTVKVLAEKT